MSRHYVDYGDYSINMGFDRPLQRIYCTIYKEEKGPDGEPVEAIFYDDLDDQNLSVFNDHNKPVMDQIKYYLYLILKVSDGAWVIPESMILGVVDDSFHQRCGEAPVKHN